MRRKASMSKTLQIGDVTVPGRVLMAPMTGITDLPFRRLASKLGAAYVATEMVAARELARERPDVVRRAAVGEGLPLTVIQLVGRDPAAMAEGARMAEKAGADIVDLNFGCPAKEVTGVAAGSALMRTPDLACRIMEAAVQATSRPVTGPVDPTSPTSASARPQPSTGASNELTVRAISSWQRPGRSWPNRSLNERPCDWPWSESTTIR